MSSVNQNDNTPFFFLVTEQYALGTPRGMAASERTIDMPFHDLTKNYDLQAKLKLASIAFIKPAWNPPFAYPMEGQELITHTAVYLASFTDDSQEKEQRMNYLVNNGLIRILITDDSLQEEVRKIIIPQ